MVPIIERKNSLSEESIKACAGIGFAVYCITIIGLNFLQKTGKIPHFHPTPTINHLITCGISLGTGVVTGVALAALFMSCQEAPREPVDEAEPVNDNHEIAPQSRVRTPNSRVRTPPLANTRFNRWLAAAFRKKNTVGTVAEGTTLGNKLQNGKEWVNRKQRAFLEGPKKTIVSTEHEFYDSYPINHDLAADLAQCTQQINTLQEKAQGQASRNRSNCVVNVRNILFDPHAAGYYFDINEVTTANCNIAEQIWQDFINDLMATPTNGTFQLEDIRDACTACIEKASDDKSKKRILYLYYLIKQSNSRDQLGIFICLLAGVTTEARCDDGMNDALFLLEKRIALNSNESEPSLAEKISLTLICQLKINYLNGYKDPRYTDTRLSAERYEEMLEQELQRNARELQHGNYEATLQICKATVDQNIQTLREAYAETNNTVALILYERMREIFNLPGSFQGISHPSYNAYKYQYLGINPLDFEPKNVLNRFFSGGDLLYDVGSDNARLPNPGLTARVAHEAVTAEFLIETLTDQIFFLPEGYHHEGIYISPANVQAFLGAHQDDPALGREIRECYALGLKKVEGETLSLQEEARFNNPNINKYFNAALQPTDRDRAKNIVKEILLALGYIQLRR